MWAARRVRGGLLGVLLGDGEGCTAGRDRGRLLGERGLCCWVGERWTPWGERAVLLGGMLGGRGLCCSTGERWTARWQKAVLLGDRGDLLGGRG
jgi:hypothetical protein